MFGFFLVDGYLEMNRNILYLIYDYMIFYDFDFVFFILFFYVVVFVIVSVLVYFIDIICLMFFRGIEKVFFVIYG